MYISECSVVAIDINYFHCLQIVEILKETEADTRSIFGGYSSQRMKDWQEVVKLYEKDNIYLAEASQILMRNVAYEIPGMKKTILKCEQMQQVRIIIVSLKKCLIKFYFCRNVKKKKQNIPKTLKISVTNTSHSVIKLALKVLI